LKVALCALLVGVALLGVPAVSRAGFVGLTSFTFSGKDSGGQLHSAEADFFVGTGTDAGKLEIVLSNTYSAAPNFQFQQTDVLGGLFFHATLSGKGNPSLSKVNDGASVTPGSSSVQGTSTGETNLGFTDVSYSWAFANGTEFKKTYNYGIGSVGFNTFDSNGLFNTGTPPSGYPTNGTQPDGVDWGLIPLNTTNFTHDSFIANGYGFIQSSATFLLSGWTSGSSIDSVLFQYGTDTSEFSGTGTQGPPPGPGPQQGIAPEPSSAALLAIGGVGLVFVMVRSRRQQVAATV
jgi:hypothetical protein